MNNKKWFQSKTIWSAIIKAVAGILSSVALILTGELTFVDFLPGAITSIWGVYDIIIRYQTGEPIVGSTLYYKMK
jgi:hypothetical protein